MIALLFAVTLSAHGAHGTPDDIPACADLNPRHPISTEKRFRTSTMQNTAWLWLRGYQIFISRANGSTCTMFPSCSRYAMQAFRREGPLLGFWMTAARLMSSHNDPAYQLCSVGDQVLQYDPPKEDAWWR